PDHRFSSKAIATATTHPTTARLQSDLHRQHNVIDIRVIQMNVHFTQTVNGERENFDDVGNGLNAKTATNLESVREWLRKNCIQQ
ncbi:MAG TPA: hypothetical protein VMZ32_02040, partial [Gammaproteobacteria bacterium]|nr:hypothetical protein [Gammaproteobacteria bacterium]